jgi:hypothetical protein
MTDVAVRAALVVAALAVALLVARRRARAISPPAAIAVLGRAALGPGLGLALVEVGGHRLLVGWGKDGVRLVREVGARAPGAAAGAGGFRAGLDLEVRP